MWVQLYLLEMCSAKDSSAFGSLKQKMKLL